MLIIKILIILIGLFYNSYSLNCEEEINKKDNGNSADFKMLKIVLIAIPICFHLGTSPEESLDSKVKFLIMLTFASVASTMFGRMIREKWYGTNPEVQAKIEKELIKEIQKLQRENDDN